MAKGPFNKNNCLIREGDRIFISRSGPVSGFWDVRDVRCRDKNCEKPELILSRGGSMAFKTVFDEKSMKLHGRTPLNQLVRDVPVSKKMQIRKP